MIPVNFCSPFPKEAAVNSVSSDNVSESLLDGGEEGVAS